MKDTLNKYVWIIDTLNRYGHLSRAEINELWLKSSCTDGRPFPERTFFHYRREIEETFHVDILCDNYGRYYIDESTRNMSLQMTNWLLESFAVNNAIQDPSIQSGRVVVEDVPSAREFLPTVLRAIGESSKVKFTYAGFTRSRPEEGIMFRPWFVKRYKQRWYMVGMKERGNDVRTYALDRVKEMQVLAEHFEMPDVRPDDIFENLIGITSSKAEVRDVRIQTTPTQAKYFRALPFHPTQQETICDKYSIFSYRLKLNYELVHELLGYGDSIKVLEPKELRLMVTEQIRSMLRLYEESDPVPEE